MSKCDVDFTQVDQFLDNYYPQMELDLIHLLTYPSVEGPNEGPGAPFGHNVAAALKHCLQIAASLNMKTENIDGYMGIASLKGTSEEAIGILSHLDVVPANPADWSSPPFEPKVIDGRIYGRGTLDDKGPLIASLYAGAALAKCSARPLAKTVRFMFGCNEENGMKCLKYYLSKFTPPKIGFSPDAQFPLIIGEKGIIHFSLKSQWQDEASAPYTLVSLTSGNAANIVPDTAQAVIHLNGGEVPQGNSRIKIDHQNEQIIIHSYGKAAHASTPELGENALASMLQFLRSLDLAPLGANKYINTLASLFEDSCYGASIGLDGEDSLSRLTLIPSILNVCDNKGTLTCDMRFPVTHNLSSYRTALENISTSHGLKLGAFDGYEPMYAGKDNETAQKLLEVYRDFTGDMSEPLVIGGGTYAKALPGFLAFGPQFPHTPSLCHQANEYISCEDMLVTAKLYARAIYALATKLPDAI